MCCCQTCAVLTPMPWCSPPPHCFLCSVGKWACFRCWGLCLWPVLPCSISIYKLFQGGASDMPQLYFFHGLESGPHGQKYHLLKNEFPELESPDFQGMDLDQRLAKAEEITRGHYGLVLVGSSFGGLLAARLYNLYPERIRDRKSVV